MTRLNNNISISPTCSRCCLCLLSLPCVSLQCPSGPPPVSSTSQLLPCASLHLDTTLTPIWTTAHFPLHICVGEKATTGVPNMPTNWQTIMAFFTLKKNIFWDTLPEGLVGNVRGSFLLCCLFVTSRSSDFPSSAPRFPVGPDWWQATDWEDSDPLMLRLGLSRRWVALSLGFERLCVVLQTGHSMRNAMGEPGLSGYSLNNIK